MDIYKTFIYEYLHNIVFLQHGFALTWFENWRNARTARYLYNAISPYHDSRIGEIEEILLV